MFFDIKFKQIVDWESLKSSDLLLRSWFYFFFSSLMGGGLQGNNNNKDKNTNS